jgi:membrane associated rhomboid family serine protease
MLVLTLLTAGFYYPWWFLQRRLRLNQLSAAPQIPRWPFLLFSACLALQLALPIWSGPWKVRPIVGPISLEGIAALALSAAWLLTVWQSLAIKRVIERYLAGPETADAGDRTPTVRLSGAQTVFFGAFYLQYAINTAILIECSAELLDQIEAAERQQFIETLTASTPHLFVTPALIALNVVMFVVVAVSSRTILAPAPAVVVRWGGDFGPLTTHGQWWRLLTAAFLHFGLLHLLMNVIILWQIGALTERLFGHVGFSVVYLLAAVGGSVASLFWHPMSVSAGASGAVFGLYGALGGFLLMQRGSMPVRVLTTLANGAALFVGLNLVAGLVWNARLELTTTSALPQNTIDLAAHLGGLAAGFLAGCALAQTLTPTRAGMRVGRSVVVGVIGTFALALAARQIPVLDDLAGVLERLRLLEGRSLALYNNSLAQLKARQLQPPQFADIVETKLLPPWNEARRSLLALRLPPPQRALAVATSAVMAWTAEEWTLTAQGVRTDNVTLVERASRKREAAEAIKASIGRRIAHAEAPRAPQPPMVVGTVNDRLRRAVPGATVRLTCASHAAPGAVSSAYWQICKTPPVARSDNSGRFQFGILPAGPYVATASAPNYRDDERDFELDDVATLAFSLRPLVDETAAALVRMASTEKNAQTIFNAALAKLKAHAIGNGQFADILERQVLPPWDAVQSSLQGMTVTDGRAELVRKAAEYMALRAEAWRLMAKAVRDSDAEMMKKANEKQAAALAVIKDVMPKGTAERQPRQ